MARVHSLGSNEELFVDLVPVWVSEVHAAHRGSTTRVMDDLTDNSLDVTISFGEVEDAELAWTLPVVGVGLQRTR